MITPASQLDARPRPSSAATTRAPALALQRVVRFSAVGAIGFVFQMSLAWALVGVWHVDPVWAWVASTEAAVLHNFMWHVRWTWADRPAPAGPTLARLVRFNLSNGAISIGGGAFVIRVLTADLGVPVLIAFVASVILCSLVNLLASEYWAFRARVPRRATWPDVPASHDAPTGTARRRPGTLSGPWRHVLCLATAVLVAEGVAQPALRASSNDQREARQRAFGAYMKRSDVVAVERVSGARPFLWIDDHAERRTRVRSGALVVEPMNREPATEVPGGLVHDWIGAVFIPGATVAQVVALVQDYDRHKVVYAPEVMDSRLISRAEQHFVAFMRFRREKVITVILDTVHDAHYARLDDTRWHSRSVTTSVREVTRAGQSGERQLGPEEGHGFMLNLNTYWRFAGQDGGVYVECQAVSLSRDIPTGLGWLMGSVVRALPRESLSRTLTSTRAGLHGPSAAGR